MVKLIANSYSRAGEILEYLRTVARKYDLYRNIKLSHMVKAARWDEERSIWTIKVEDTTTGTITEDWCHFMISGSGILKSVWSSSASENHDVNLRVAIGNGLTSPVYAHSRVNFCTVQLGTRRRTTRERLLQFWVVAPRASRSFQQFSQVWRSLHLQTRKKDWYPTDVKQLVTFIRTPTWITAGFAQSKAGPGGSNFSCMHSMILCAVHFILDWQLAQSARSRNPNSVMTLLHIWGIEKRLRLNWMADSSSSSKTVQSKKKPSASPLMRWNPSSVKTPRCWNIWSRRSASGAVGQPRETAISRRWARRTYVWLQTESRKLYPKESEQAVARSSKSTCSYAPPDLTFPSVPDIQSLVNMVSV